MSDKSKSQNEPEKHNNVSPKLLKLQDECTKLSLLPAKHNGGHPNAGHI